MLCSGRLDPSEVTDDLGISQRFGAGYYRVQARGLAGRILGAPYHVGIPDEEGKVPVTSGDDEAPAVAASDGGGGALMPLMMEWMKLQQKQFSDEISRAREDARDNLAAFANINEQTIKTLSLVNAPAPSHGADTRFEALSSRLDKLVEENTALRIELVKASVRRDKGSGEDDFWREAVGAALPKILDVMSQPRARRVSDQVQQQQQRARARTAVPRESRYDSRSDQPAEEPAGDAVAGEVIDAPEELSDAEKARRVAVLGFDLPPVEEVRAAVAAGPLSPKHIELFTVLRDAGLLSKPYRDALVSAL